MHCPMHMGCRSFVSTAVAVLVFAVFARSAAAGLEDFEDYPDYPEGWRGHYGVEEPEVKDEDASVDCCELVEIVEEHLESREEMITRLQTELDGCPDLDAWQRAEAEVKVWRKELNATYRITQLKEIELRDKAEAAEELTRDAEFETWEAKSIVSAALRKAATAAEAKAAAERATADAQAVATSSASAKVRAEQSRRAAQAALVGAQAELKFARQQVAKLRQAEEEAQRMYDELSRYHAAAVLPSWLGARFDKATALEYLSGKPSSDREEVAAQ